MPVFLGDGARGGESVHAGLALCLEHRGVLAAVSSLGGTQGDYGLTQGLRASDSWKRGRNLLRSAICLGPQFSQNGHLRRKSPWLMRSGHLGLGTTKFNQRLSARLT